MDQDELDIIVDEENAKVTFVEISADEKAPDFRSEVVIPYFRGIFKVSSRLTPSRSPNLRRFRIPKRLTDLRLSNIQIYQEFLEKECSQSSTRTQTRCWTGRSS